MKLKTFDTFALFLFCSSAIFAQNNDNFDYNQFKLYFDDVKEQRHIDEKLIPNNSFTKFLYGMGDEREQIYGRTKISYPNSYDLFILREFLDYNDEELPNIDYLFYLIFYDGKLVEEYYSNALYRVLEINTDTDGGSMEQSFEIEKDSSLLINYYHYDCCSSTGFYTPIETKTKARFRVGSSGHLELQEVLEVQFTSPFFDAEFLKQKKEKETDFDYPTQDNYYNLVVENTIQKIPIFKDDIQLYFYIKSTNDILQPVLIIHDSHSNMSMEELDIKCPLVIKNDYLNLNLTKCSFVVKIM